MNPEAITHLSRADKTMARLIQKSVPEAKTGNAHDTFYGCLPATQMQGGGNILDRVMKNVFSIQSEQQLIRHQ